MLYDAFGQREVSTMYTGLNQYFVVMEVDPKYQLSPDALNGIYIKATSAGSDTGHALMRRLSRRQLPRRLRRESSRTVAPWCRFRRSLSQRAQVNHQGQYPR